MRNAYFDQLDSIVDELVDMTQVVQVAVARATQALLTADAEIAEKVISDDAAIDAARERVESKSFELLALQQPVASDLRMLVAALRMVADLERMGTSPCTSRRWPGCACRRSRSRRRWCRRSSAWPWSRRRWSARWRASSPSATSTGPASSRRTTRRWTSCDARPFA